MLVGMIDKELVAVELRLPWLIQRAPIFSIQPLADPTVWHSLRSTMSGLDMRSFTSISISRVYHASIPPKSTMCLPKRLAVSLNFFILGIFKFLSGVLVTAVQGAWHSGISWKGYRWRWRCPTHRPDAPDSPPWLPGPRCSGFSLQDLQSKRLDIWTIHLEDPTSSAHLPSVLRPSLHLHQDFRALNTFSTSLMLSGTRL